MKELCFNELENNTIPYKELQCVLGAYFRPSILRHQSWQSIAKEIVSYCTPRCVTRIIRQIAALLSNPAITSRRLATWVKRYATTWTCQQDSQARDSLEQLQAQLSKALRETLPTSVLLPTPSFA